jgi:hypothetical protein
MNPHDYHAPGLAGSHYEKIINAKPHVAIWRGNNLVRCSCGKPLDDETQYRQHIRTKASYGDAHKIGKK